MIEYRRATASDAEAIARLHARSWRETYRGSFRDAFLDGDLVDERLQVWRERLEHPPANQSVQLALAGGSLAGFICVYAAQDPRWGSLIDNLHVSSRFKGRGVGSELMRQAGSWLATAAPGHGVYLLVLEANAGARRFYEGLGGTNAGVSTLTTHGDSVVRSCRYVWEGPARLSGA